MHKNPKGLSRVVASLIVMMVASASQYGVAFTEFGRRESSGLEVTQFGKIADTHQFRNKARKRALKRRKRK